MSADRNLLFGILALQLEFLTRDQLIAGMQAWVNDKSRSLGEILERTGALDATNRQLLEPLVERHIRQHGNDPQQSLASLSSADRLRQELEEIQDADVQQSLATIGWTRSPSPPDPKVTLEPTQSLGVQTSAGTRFRILRPHARGGLGEVYVARDTELGREVALKEIQLDKSHDPDARARFTREAEITGGLEHPGIVPVYGLGAYPDGRPFYAMRFIRGKSLQDAIKAYHSKEKTNPTEQNLELRRLLQRFIDVCEAIDYAHSRGVLHRDLKPGNIMLGRYGETLVVDWGLAKAVGRVSNPSPPSSKEPIDTSASQLPEPTLKPSSHDSSEATQLGSALGTIAYMSPEQANGRWDLLGPASDVFSLGATLYHLLTGQPPYTGKRDEAFARAVLGEYPRPCLLARHIPAPLEAICLKALALEPKDRYPTAEAFAQDIERYLADEPIAALPESMVSRGTRWARRHRHWMQAGGVALLLVTITAIGAYFYQRETALQNQRLANEKGQLAEEKGKLADERGRLVTEKTKLANDNLQLAHEAEAKTDSLRSALARNYFARGLTEYAAGREKSGIVDLQRALALLPQTDPLCPHHEIVLLDRALRATDCFLTLPHKGSVYIAAFSPQGDRILTASHDGTVRLWDPQIGTPIGEPLPHGFARVVGVAFSPHGDRVLTASLMAARLWDARTGAPIGKPLQHEFLVRAAAFSPKGDCVLTGSLDHTARLWDARTGAPIGEPFQHEDSVSDVTFSPEGDRILTGSYDKTARLWDAQTGAPIGEPLTHEDSLNAVAFSPKGDRILTGSYDKTARLWDAQTGAPIGEPLQHQGDVIALAFSPEGDRVLTGSRDHSARLWDARTGATVGEPLQHEGPVLSLTFSPQGDRILTGSWDHTARLWDARTGAPIGKPLRHEGAVGAVTFSPKGDRVLTASEDKTARLWDARIGAALGEPLRHDRGVRAVAFSPQGDRVLTGSFDKTARLWDARTGAPVGEPLQHEEFVFAVAFCPQGDRVLTGSITARLWDARTGVPVVETLRHESFVQAVAFSPLGDRILTASDVAQLWDAMSGAPVGEPLRHEEAILAVAYSSQGDRILTGSLDNTARLWDARTSAPIGATLRHRSPISAVAFSPQGDRILTGSEDKTARLWNAQTGAPEGEPFWHEGPVAAVAFSPQGDRILTGSVDARQWDVQTHAQLGEPLRHDGPVRAVAFSPDGNRVLTAGGKTARLWDVSFRHPQNTAKFAVLVSGHEVDRDTNARQVTPDELLQLRKRFYEEETEWLTARERTWHQRYLLNGIVSHDLFAVYQSARWLPEEELAQLETSLGTLAMQVLVAWFRDGKLDQVAGELTGATEAPEAGKVLKALKEAIPVLYWVTDERLGRLGKELEKLAMQQSPAPN